MVQISHSRLAELFTCMQGRRIAIIGDLMLDRYIWGSVNRISPEAPVPVIDMEAEQARLGGAANVAMNIQSLGGEPLLVGVIGSDNSGRRSSAPSARGPVQTQRRCFFPANSWRNGEGLEGLLSNSRVARFVQTSGRCRGHEG